jgi:hypothetical protein
MSSDKSSTGGRHDLDDRALGDYLLRTNAIPGLKLPLLSTKIGYGQSNPTYFVDDAAYVFDSLANYLASLLDHLDLTISH